MTESRKKYIKAYKATDSYKEKVNTAEYKQYMKEYQATDAYKERARKYHATDAMKEKRLMKRYGITMVDYNNMFASQNGCCKICGTHQSELKNSLSVDHCHTTLNVRGLLCQICNTALGGFKDDINLLSKAVEYLKINK